jgi:hypothetical protein
MTTTAAIVLALHQLAWSARGLEPDGAPYASAAEAEAAAGKAARDRLGDFSADDLAEAISEHVKADEITDARLVEIKAGAELTDPEAIMAAEELCGFEYAVYPVDLSLDPVELLGSITGAADDGPSAAALLETGAVLALRAFGAEGRADLLAAVNALGRWAADVTVAFPGLDYDEPVPTLVSEIEEGDAVDLEGAPGCTGPNFMAAEFELATCLGAERESPGCIRLDFEGYPSVGFDPDLRLPVRKRGAYDPATGLRTDAPEGEQ